VQLRRLQQEVTNVTRKHFAALAWELRQAYPTPGATMATDLGSDWYAGQVRQWERDTLAIERVCAASNGGFDSDRFGIASGRIRRPDGSMYPMAAPR
jgi:hypothetical protein